MNVLIIYFNMTLCDWWGLHSDPDLKPFCYNIFLLVLCTLRVTVKDLIFTNQLWYIITLAIQLLTVHSITWRFLGRTKNASSKQILTVWLFRLCMLTSAVHYGRLPSRLLCNNKSKWMGLCFCLSHGHPQSLEFGSIHTHKHTSHLSLASVDPPAEEAWNYYYPTMLESWCQLMNWSRSTD